MDLTNNGASIANKTERESTMTTTCYALGFRAARDYILSNCNGDWRLVELIEKAFNRIASEHGSNAVLLTDTSEALVHIETEPEDCDYEAWLEEAHQEAAEAWVDELESDVEAA